MSANSTSKESFVISITVKDIPAVVQTALVRNRNPFFLSPPGVGKTQIITGLARKAGVTLIVLVASLLDRLDLAGLPYVKLLPDGRRVTDFAPMELFSSLSVEHAPDGPPVWLYLNELNAAADLSVMPVLYRLLAERAIGSLHLRENVFLIADGNPTSSMSAGRDMHMAMRRRFEWFNVRADVGIWKDWALTHGVDARVASFFTIPAFAGHFCNFDAKDRLALTFGCPATWAKLGEDLGTILEKTGGSDDLRLAMFVGYVGEKAGANFDGYLKLAGDIPDAALVLKNPASAVIPQEIEKLALLCGSIVNLCTAEPTLSRASMELACRLRNTEGLNGHGEFALFLTRSLTAIGKCRKVVITSPHFHELAKIISSDHFALEATMAA